MGCSNVKEQDVIAVTSTADPKAQSKAKLMNDSDEESKMEIVQSPSSPRKKTPSESESPIQ